MTSQQPLTTPSAPVVASGVPPQGPFSQLDVAGEKFGAPGVTSFPPHRRFPCFCPVCFPLLGSGTFFIFDTKGLQTFFPPGPLSSVCLEVVLLCLTSSFTENVSSVLLSSLERGWQLDWVDGDGHLGRGRIVGAGEMECWSFSPSFFLL